MHGHIPVPPSLVSLISDLWKVFEGLPAVGSVPLSGKDIHYPAVTFISPDQPYFLLCRRHSKNSLSN